MFLTRCSCACDPARERAVGLHVYEEPGAAAALPVDAAVRQQARPEGQGPGAAQTHPESTLRGRRSERRDSILHLNTFDQQHSLFVL